jgi:hypothetical protein
MMFVAASEIEIRKYLLSTGAIYFLPTIIRHLIVWSFTAQAVGVTEFVFAYPFREGHADLMAQLRRGFVVLIHLGLTAAISPALSLRIGFVSHLTTLRTYCVMTRALRLSFRLSATPSFTQPAPLESVGDSFKRNHRSLRAPAF